MNNGSSQNELPRSTTNIQTLLETCVLDTDHKALEEHLVNNPVQQSDLDRCLLSALPMMHQNEKELSRVVQSLTILLQSGAKWNSDVLLDEQKTPYHIICDSLGDHHELLDLMIKSSQKILKDAQDFYKQTALMYAVKNANINCLKCLIANGANVNIGTKKCPALVAGKIKSWTPIMKAIWVLRRAFKYRSVIMSDIFDVLLDAAVDQNKDHFRSCTDYIQCALIAGNVNCIKKLIQMGAPLNNIAHRDRYVWVWIAREGNVEMLKCMLDQGFDKDSIDHNGYSVLWWVVVSGNIEAVRYLLDLGVAIPNYSPKVREPHYRRYKENRLIISDHKKQEKQDPCIRAIRDNELKIVKLLDEYGSKSYKSFTALRCAVSWDRKDVVSFLLSKYSYPLNTEYAYTRKTSAIFTLLTEPACQHSDRVTKMLLHHGADPVKPMCETRSANAFQQAIYFKYLKAMARYIRSGFDINLRSWTYIYENDVSPFEASVLHNHRHISVMLLVSGCSRGVFHSRKFLLSFNKRKLRMKKLMTEWNVYDDNRVTSLQQRCRSVILSHLSPQADVNIRKLPLPPCVIKFLGIPELDDIIDAYNAEYPDANSDTDPETDTDSDTNTDTDTDTE